MESKNIISIMDAKLIMDENPGKKIVIITGVTGQDGSHMVDYLLKANEDILIFGGVRRLSVSNHKNISHIDSDRFHLINFDLTDAHVINTIIEKLKPDYFINFAAQSFVASSWDFPRQTWQTNSTSIIDILEAIRLYKPTCRFYNAGSSEEFGNVAYSPQDENHPLKPRSPYGASKVAARQIVKVYRESYGLYAIQGWLFNHEGIRRGDEFVTRKITRGVSRIHNCIKNKKSFTPIELGNLYAKRDWSDAEDFMECIWMMLNQEIYRKDLSNSIQNWYTFVTKDIREYVLSSEKTHTIKEFIEKAFSVAGINGVWTGSDFSEEFTLNLNQSTQDKSTPSVLVKINKNFYRPAEVDLLLGNCTEFKNDFNWSSKTTFDELIVKMVKNDLRN